MSHKRYTDVRLRIRTKMRMRIIPIPTEVRLYVPVSSTPAGIIT